MNLYRIKNKKTKITKKKKNNNIKNIKNKNKKITKNMSLRKYKKTKKTKKLRGGANCPKTGFHQHKGECWNDTMMMILCYSNGISEKVNEFFQYITANTTGKTNEEIKAYISDEINKIDTPVHKNTYYFLLPLTIDIDNPAQYYTFKQAAVDYISNMYLRYINETKYINVDDSPSKKLLTRQLSVVVSEACSKANYDLMNLNINKDSLQVYGSAANTHSGSYINDIFTISIINYFIMNFNINEDKNLITFLNSKLTRFPDSFYNIKIQKPGGSFITEQEMNDLTEMIQLLKTNNELSLKLALTRSDLSGGHAISFFTCNQEIEPNNKNYYYNNNGIEKGNHDILLYEVDWKTYLINKFELMIKYNTFFLQKNNNFQNKNNEQLLALTDNIKDRIQFYETNFANYKTYIQQFIDYNIINIPDVARTSLTDYTRNSIQAITKENYNLENLYYTISTLPIEDLFIHYSTNTPLLIKNLSKIITFMLSNFPTDDENNIKIYFKLVVSIYSTYNLPMAVADQIINSDTQSLLHPLFIKYGLVNPEE